MKLKTLFIISLLFIPLASAETVYKTVDEEGNIIFSDTPAAGAEQIEIKEAQSITIPDVQSFADKPETEKETGYSRLAVTSPENESTIHNNEGNVNISVEIEPALNEKDLIALFMNGEQIAIGRSGQFSLTNIDRGTQTIYVAVKNANNEILQRSNTVEFHLRQMSKLFPKPPSTLTPEAQKQARPLPTPAPPPTP